MNINHFLLAAGIILNSILFAWIAWRQKKLIQEWNVAKKALGRMFNLDIDEMISEAND